MSLEIYKLYNNQEKAINKFEVVHEGVYGNVRIEPYLIKNTDNSFFYSDVNLQVESLTGNNDTFVFKIILKETEPTEEEWDQNNTSNFLILNIAKKDLEGSSYKFWVRTYIGAGIVPQKYSDKINLKLTYKKTASE